MRQPVRPRRFRLLAAHRLTGCTLDIGLDASFVLLVAGATARLPLVLPAAFASGQNPLGVVASRGQRLTIGR